MTVEDAELDALEAEMVRALDAELAPRDGDDELLARAVGAALVTSPSVAAHGTGAAPAGATTRTLLAVLLGGSLVLVGVLVAPLVSRPGRDQPTSTAAPADNPVATAHEDPVDPPPPAVAPAEKRRAIEPPPAAQPESSQPEPPSRASASTSDAPEPSAEELFAKANRERRERDYEAALETYAMLAKLHPGTRQELTARVTRGRLLLDVDDEARLALESFEGYLDDAPKGALVEEAMVGKALALEALDRSEEARAIWKDLLERFPDSFQAARARQALGQR